ncbi:hypothetical protein J1N35_009896 [Gossypium stocksii]|uniref:Uncharacterized protein n=1 Tax=Gossypium stocksii TaxID=47602 RepID=A0A9D3W1E6_9ROSI|nr:hypothetical protein J1N35_009896 [Gossypium stocksii]
MAAYHYRITSKALVIMSVLILAWQLVAARLVPADRSSAPVIGCNAKGYTPVYGGSCPPPNVLPIKHSSAPVIIGGNVTGNTSVYGKSCPPLNALPADHSSAPVIGGNVTGYNPIYGKSGPPN